MGRPRHTLSCLRRCIFAVIGIALLVFALSAADLFAQAPSSKMFGTVTDEQGTPLPGVAVEATSPKLVGKGRP